MKTHVTSRLLRAVVTGLAALAMLVAAKVTTAETGGSDGSDPTTVDSRVEALLEMEPDARRAHLKAMDPAERRGLWFEVKREQVRRRGGTGARAGRDALAPDHRDAADVRTPATKRAVGTIAYHSGMPTLDFGGNTIIGNRFDTHTGIPVLASGTVSTVQAVVVPGSAQTSSSAGFVLLGPQTGGGGAMAIFSTFTGATGTQDTVTFAGIGASYTGSSFFVLFGDFEASYLLAFGTASTLGQGHHGVNGITGGMGPNITATSPLTGVNGFINATGNIVPVELMSFEVN